jgi:hypothetical protein
MLDPNRSSSAVLAPSPEREEEVVEVSLLLPGWQVQALAEAAQARGLTTGEMVRQLLRRFLAQPERPARVAP